MRRMMAREVSKIGTPIERSGTPTDTCRELDEAVLMAVLIGSVARTKPRYMDPVSPRNTEAGWKL